MLFFTGNYANCDIYFVNMDKSYLNKKPQPFI